jgi:hypothetical protein
MVDLKKLLVLKDKLIKAKDFKEPCDYFLTHFGENPDFIKLGAAADSEFLLPIIEELGKALLKHRPTDIRLAITEIAEYQFLHGACFLDGRIANLMYFKDIDMGILSLLQAGPPMGVQMARFSCVYKQARPPHAMH